jgi:hypothetical protein
MSNTAKGRQHVAEELRMQHFVQDRWLQTAGGAPTHSSCVCYVSKASMHLKAVHGPYNANPVVYDMQQ